MFRILFLSFLIVPLIEIYVLIKVGQVIGAWQTIVLMIAAGVAGAYLAKRQGYVTWQRFQTELSMGRMPGDSLLDGAFVLIGGVLLLTPGFVSDILGFILLLPVTRESLKRLIKHKLEKKLSQHTSIYFR